VQLKAAAYDAAYYDFTRSNWFETEVGRQKVLGEVRKINEYFSLGYLAELEGRGAFPEVSELDF